MSTISARVNARLLDKASRMFTGTLPGRIIEILQNARRAGARHVIITNREGTVSVRDDGRGIEDFQALLDLGGSNWNQKTEAAEDPAGVGLFCLAPRRLGIRSHGHRMAISGKGWTGAPVEVTVDPQGLQALSSITAGTGTELSFPDEPWTADAVKPLAVFSGLEVTVDGEACPREEFIKGPAAHYPELGCRIQVVGSPVSHWHRDASLHREYSDRAWLNFHGQMISFSCYPVSEELYFLIDMTGEPTGLRLMLPARTRLVENGPLLQLQAVLEREAYLFLQRRGHHKLPYKQFLRARELKIELPESQPVYQVGLLQTSMEPEPVPVTMSDNHPLAQCYRLAEDQDGQEADMANAHLLAALGSFDRPLVPVAISPLYDGYSWAKLPAIGKVEVAAGKVLQESLLGSGELFCVDSLAITCHCSDGRVFCSPVPMAVKPPVADADFPWSSEDLYVTPEARETLTAEQVWYHLGGYSEEGDTYDTQLDYFSEALDRFWLRLAGPFETIRSKLLAATEGLPKGWQMVTIRPDGQVVVLQADGQEQVIPPPQNV